MTSIAENRVERILAWLIRNEGVQPDSIERAIDAANSMKFGESITLEGDDLASMRRAFVFEQVRRLKKI